jgi:hypothetical protein
MLKASSKAVTKTSKAQSPKKIAAPPKKTATSPAKPKAMDKPQKVKAPKTPPAKSLIKQTSDAISELASDILADRIVPTIEQIKSLAASALGQDQTKGKSNAKGKKPSRDKK